MNKAVTDYRSPQIKTREAFLGLPSFCLLIIKPF